MSATELKNDTQVTREDSRPVRYELINKWGNPHGIFPSAAKAAAYARANWPDQEQDPNRTGAGWDVQTVGAE